MTGTRCRDGGRHVWHFFTRLGLQLRECKKCPALEVVEAAD